MAPPAPGVDLETSGGGKNMSSLQSSSSPRASSHQSNRNSRKKHHSPNPSRRNNGGGGGVGGGGGSGNGRRPENGRHNNNKTKRSPPRNNNNRPKTRSPRAPTRSLIIVAANDCQDDDEGDVVAVQGRAQAPKKNVITQDSFASSSLSSLFPPMPAPFTMCTSAEAADRQEHFELSIFECLQDGTWSDRVVNPRAVVKKYRRSAAAGGVEAVSEDSNKLGSSPPSLPSLQSRIPPKTRPTVVVGARPRLVNNDNSSESPRSSSPKPLSRDNEEAVSTKSDQRSLESLETTVSYLLGLLLPFQGLAAHDTAAQDENTSQQTLAATASFVDDRLRAVQVDLVTLLGSLPHPTATAPASPPASPQLSSLASKSSSLQRHVQKASAQTPTAPTTREQQAARQREAQREVAHNMCTTLRTVRSMQARIVRYGILLHYLLSHVQDGTKYEHKFGMQGLQTALTSYLEHANTEASVSHLDSHEFHFYANEDERRRYEEELDEILSYGALLKIASVIRCRERALPPAPTSADESGAGFTSILLDYRRHVRSAQGGGRGIACRFWKRALDIAAAADAGNYVRLLRLLQNDAVGLSSLARLASTDSANSGERGTAAGPISELVDEEAIQTAAKSKGAEERWGILARCCMVPALSSVRIDMIRQFNKSFGKLEKVPATSLANLLHLPSSEAALEFAEAIGLPTNRTEEQHAVLSSPPTVNPPLSPVPPHRITTSVTAAASPMSSLQMKAAGMSSLAAAASSPKRTPCAAEESSPSPMPPAPPPPPSTSPPSSSVAGLCPPPPDYIVMKAAGISIARAKENGVANESVLHPGRSEDPFVFGPLRHDVWTSLLEKGPPLPVAASAATGDLSPLPATRQAAATAAAPPPDVPELERERSTTPPPRVLGRRKGTGSNISNTSSNGGGGGPVEGSRCESLSPRPPARRWADDSDSDDDILDWEDVDEEDEEDEDEDEDDFMPENALRQSDGNNVGDSGYSPEVRVRLDQDGVRVPPPTLIWDLIQ